MKLLIAIAVASVTSSAMAAGVGDSEGKTFPQSQIGGAPPPSAGGGQLLPPPRGGGGIEPSGGGGISNPAGGISNPAGGVSNPVTPGNNRPGEIGNDRATSSGKNTPPK